MTPREISIALGLDRTADVPARDELMALMRAFPDRQTEDER